MPYALKTTNSLNPRLVVSQAGPWNADRKNELPLERAKEIVDGDRQLGLLADRDFPTDSYVVGGHTYRTNPQTLKNPDYVAWLRRNMEKIKAADPEKQWEDTWNKLPEGWRKSDSSGYPAYYLCQDWDLRENRHNDTFVLCTSCFQKEAKDRHWLPIAFHMNEEDGNLFCEECNDQIPSAYGNDEVPREQ